MTILLSNICIPYRKIAQELPSVQQVAEEPDFLDDSVESVEIIEQPEDNGEDLDDSGFEGQPPGKPPVPHKPSNLIPLTMPVENS